MACRFVVFPWFWLFGLRCGAILVLLIVIVLLVSCLVGYSPCVSRSLVGWVALTSGLFALFDLSLCCGLGYFGVYVWVGLCCGACFVGVGW